MELAELYLSRREPQHPDDHPGCTHCGILINPVFDRAHVVEVEGEAVIICDSCHNDYLVYGPDFGDGLRGECLHTKWAAEDAAEQRRLECESA